MAAILEREVKLRFTSANAARSALGAAGAVPLRGRRLQSDVFLDTDSGDLRVRRCALRVRGEANCTYVTFKGPVQPARTKVREEIETLVEDGRLLLRIFGELGFRICFRAEKYREEFQLPGVIVAIDETPIGTFVELEGDESSIDSAASALGRSLEDYVLDSYRSLFERDCVTRGVPVTDMLFPTPPATS
jgi:adenylate cyclase class 2